MKEELQFLLFFVFIASTFDDTLIKAKLEFFVALAKPLQEFLVKFQTKDSFLGFVFKRFVTGYHGLFSKK